MRLTLRLLSGALLVVFVWAAAVVLAQRTNESKARNGAPAIVAVTPDTGTAPPPRSRFTVSAAAEPTPVQISFKDPPRAGLLFDVASGRVLWQLHPKLPLPIASLTKMMTALVIAERHQLQQWVLITSVVLHARGSAVGVLPRGHRVQVGSLLDGLLLVSGNDAAIALAQFDAGSVDAFIQRMNTRATELGMNCSHFSTPSGIKDEGNYSCPIDLATLARADLADPVVRRIVGTPRARFPFPIKGGYLDLVNINPFLEQGVPGITGIKTGLTARAGRCYVITQRQGNREVGVVLLNSPDPLHQVPQLLRAGLRASS